MAHWSTFSLFLRRAENRAQGFMVYINHNTFSAPEEEEEGGEAALASVFCLHFIPKHQIESIF